MSSNITQPPHSDDTDSRTHGSEGRLPLRKVGVAWRPRSGSKALMSGSITINRLKQKFWIFKNTRKVQGSTDPDFHILASEDPQVDEFAKREGRTR
jgi:hypothetical protein